MSAPPVPSHRVAVMEGVREHNEGLPVELWRDERGRLVIRAYNEAGCNSVDLDLWDILDWLSTGRESQLVLAPGKGDGINGNDSGRD
jgi:hypothetical protein